MLNGAHSWKQGWPKALSVFLPYLKSAYSSTLDPSRKQGVAASCSVVFGLKVAVPSGQRSVHAQRRRGKAERTREEFAWWLHRTS